MQPQYTVEATEDILEIWRYVALSSERQADKVVQEIYDHCELLAGSPMIGESCEKYRPGLRRSRVGRFLIFYQPMQNGIHVARILHGARDIDSLF